MGGGGKSPGARFSVLPGPQKRGTIAPGVGYADMVRASIKKPGDDKLTI